MKKISELFPLSSIKNIKLFYVLTGVYNLWFVAGVWVFIWRRFMTNTEIGISDAITFSAGFLFELPSGVIADIIGRKKAILIANLLLTFGNFGVAFSNSFTTLTLCYLIWTLGYALQSGATEALAYDSLKKEGKEDEWNKVVGSATIITRLASMSANVIGGMLFVFWFRLPYLIFAISGIIGIIASYNLIEIPVKKIKNPWSVKLYFEQIRYGLSVLKKPIVFPIALISLCVSGMAYLYNWGLLRPLTAERFGYNAVTIPILLVFVSVGVILSTIFLVKNKNKIPTVKGIFMLTGLFAFVFALMGLSYNWFLGGIIMILVSITSSLTEQLFSQFINNHTKSEHRATTLSATALITKMPYVFLALLLGILADKNLLAQFCLVAGGVASLVWLVSYYKNQITINNQQNNSI